MGCWLSILGQKWSVVPILKRNKIKYTRLTKHAITPYKHTQGSAGYDLYSAYDYIVPAYDYQDPEKSKQMIATDICFELPDNTFGAIWETSKISYYNMLHFYGRVIDSDYRGNVYILVHNFSKQEFKIKSGDKIAQIIITKIMNTDLKECSYTCLSNTERAAKGIKCYTECYDQVD